MNAAPAPHRLTMGVVQKGVHIALGSSARESRRWFCALSGSVRGRISEFRDAHNACGAKKGPSTWTSLEGAHTASRCRDAKPEHCLPNPQRRQGCEGPGLMSVLSLIRCCACRSDECHSASTVYLLSCDCTPSSSAVRFLPHLGRRNLAALFYRQARRKLQVQA